MPTKHRNQTRTHLDLHSDTFSLVQKEAIERGIPRTALLRMLVIYGLENLEEVMSKNKVWKGKKNG